MTKTQRLILANQFEILQHLTGTDYSDKIKVLKEGMKHYYDDIESMVDDDIPDAVSDFVTEVFVMLDGIECSNGRLENPIEHHNLKFRGFCGNNETEHLSFAKFTIEVKDLWSNHRPENGIYNSHSQVAGRYSRMLERYNQVSDKNRMTREELMSVLEA